MKHRLLLLLAYLVVGLFVTCLWTYCARTELNADVLDGTARDGQKYCWRFCSIVRLADGTAVPPFVKRRLLPDLAQGLASLPPRSVWATMERLVNSQGFLARKTRTLFHRLGWQAEHYPLLVSASLLLWLAVVGFMLSCRWLVRQLYETPRWLADAMGALLGLALLGGNGDWHYAGYPYDFPHAFLFTLTLAAMLAGRWWFVLTFALAVYSKETSILLILAYGLLSKDRRSLSFWSVAGLLVALFAVIRYWIELSYPSGPKLFWFPRRNARFLLLQAFYVWYAPFLGVALARFVALHRLYPARLKHLCLLAVPMLGLAFFKGWIEEMRQYLELLPIMGLLVVQWTLHEAGLGGLFQPRGQALRLAEETEPEGPEDVLQPSDDAWASRAA